MAVTKEVALREAAREAARREGRYQDPEPFGAGLRGAAIIGSANVASTVDVKIDGELGFNDLPASEDYSAEVPHWWRDHRPADLAAATKAGPIVGIGGRITAKAIEPEGDTFIDEHGLARSRNPAKDMWAERVAASEAKRETEPAYRATREAQWRKDRPLARGVLDYFPDALLEVAYTSKIGNDQHNPGQPMHWAKGKSADHPDALLRHLKDRGTLDSDGVRHSAKVAWRALALLQEELDATRGEEPTAGGIGR